MLILERLFRRRELLAAAVGGLTSSRSSQQSPRSVATDYFRAAERGDIPAILQLCAATLVYEDVTFGFRIEGHAQVSAMLRGAFAALAPAKREVTRLIADGEGAVIEWVAEGTHAAPMLGVAASGRTLRIRAVSLLAVERGRIMRITDYTDRVGLQTQLGLPPR